MPAQSVWFSSAERMPTEPEPHPAGRSPRVRSLPAPGRRATVVGAGSFGTALAVLLARGGLRTTLQTRTAEQAELIERQRENVRYLPGVELPPQLRIEPASAGVARADYVFLAVPSSGLGELIERLSAAGLGRRTAVVSVAKGLVPPRGLPPTVVLSASFGAGRVACLGGPAHAQEMVHAGAALVAACARRSWRGRSPRCSRARGSYASSPTTPSAWSWRARPRTRRRSPPAPPRRKG